ncbi:MAG: MerR family transcriptional regulator [Ectothiorhodospiraceae bacterium]|nr:MerR family transcriptional regulator [Ectothiorhodospiraceae bacterium]
MFTVSELAGRAEVTPDTVRHYVQIGMLNPERNPHNGYKLFTGTDVTKLRFIRQAQSLGFSLAEIGEILNHSKSGSSPCPQVREMMQRRVVENKQKLDNLNHLQKRMEDALESWEMMPNGHPNGDSVCHLIESVTVANSNA